MTQVMFSGGIAASAVDFTENVPYFTENVLTSLRMSLLL